MNITKSNYYTAYPKERVNFTSAENNTSSGKFSEPLKRKTMAGIGLALAALATFGIVTLNLRKGKKTDIQDLSQGAKDVAGIIKKFTDENNQDVQNVILQKGKAVLPDGSFFSGLMETVNKKGASIAIKYKDGFMQESSINGVLYKTYEELKNIPAYIEKNVAKYSRDEGVRVNLFDKNGLSKIFMHVYDSDGKVTRNVMQNSDGIYNMLDIQNGRIVAMSQFKHLNLRSLIFDESGDVISRVHSEGPLTFITKFNPDGSKTQVGSHILYDIVGTPATSYKPVKPKIARFYELFSNSPYRTIEAKFKGKSHILADEITMPDGTLREVFIQIPVGKLCDDKNKYVIFSLYENSQLITQAQIGEQAKNVAYNVARKEMPQLEQAVRETVEHALKSGIEFDYQKISDNLPRIYNF